MILGEQEVCLAPGVSPLQISLASPGSHRDTTLRALPSGGKVISPGYMMLLTMAKLWIKNR